MPKKVVILGAGLAGLGCGFELVKNGLDVTILEKDSEIGGLAKSLDFGGFRCDLGPHRFHSKKKEIIKHLKDLMEDNLCIQRRRSKIFLKNRFFDYPLNFANVISSMPPLTISKILYDYAKVSLQNRTNPRADHSFEDWVSNRFGKTLYQIFFQEYTEKTWGLPCSEISSDWATQRITLLNLWDTIIKTIAKPKDMPRTYLPEFYYPKTGGIGEISKMYRESIGGMGGKIYTNTKIEKLILKNQSIEAVSYIINDRRHFEKFDLVLSTIPLNTVVNLIEPPPQSTVLQACSEIFFRSIVFVYLLLNRERLGDNHWIYVPQKRYLSNRITEFKNFSENNSPPNKTVIGSEITCFFGDRIWNMNKDRLVERTVKDLQELDLLKANEVLDSFVYRIKHAYPIYDLYYRDHLDPIRNYLDQIENLKYFGRNAMFRYNNMDQAVDMGLSVATSVLEEKNNDYVMVGQKGSGLVKPV